jgi:hypothetical protein
LQDLRSAETKITDEILSQCSSLIYKFHEHALDVTLQRAGIAAPTNNNREEEENSDGPNQKRFALACQEAKERIYMILKEYDWLKDFFRKYPLHFYENSFEFVHRIPLKRLPVQVKIVGLGIGGSMALSGLAKRGIAVTGYEKRCETGPRSVTSRYQNASWRAYDTAEKMVNADAYELLVANRQQVHVSQQDGTTKIVSSDRVQIILGSAIQAALNSAREYGAEVVLECTEEDILPTTDHGAPDTDIVALFCGAHTLTAFPGLAQELGVMTWPELDSRCRMWLQLRVSDKVDGYCARGGEIGTEHWHYTIESARQDVLDIDRVQWNQESQYEFLLRKLEKGQDIGVTKEELTATYNKQKAHLEKVKDAVMAQQEKDKTAMGSRFDYIFTNAPANDHNLAKRQAVDDAVVLDGEYTVEIKITQNASIRSGDMLNKFNTQLVVCGGDACVPPNPLAAYGATLACEAAYSLVLLVVAMGHLNAIEDDLEDMAHFMNGEDWIKEVRTLKRLMTLHYESRARSENYFQFVQTLICNLYSLPPFY